MSDRSPSFLGHNIYSQRFSNSPLAMISEKSGPQSFGSKLPVKSGNRVCKVPVHGRGGVVAEALIDATDLPLVGSLRWCRTTDGYARASTASHLRMHRIILGLSPGDGRECDHINRNRLDNRRANLRVCSRSTNLHNRGPFRTSKSGIKGVAWNAGAKRWCAYLNVGGKRVHTSYHREQADAITARQTAERAHG